MGEAEVLEVLAGLLAQVKAMRVEGEALRSEVRELKAKPAPSPAVKPPAPPDDRPQYVTLDQLAALVKMSKRSLERYKKGMPPPAMKGKRGRTARWVWSEVRPWLSAEFAVRLLPERYPEWHERES